MEQIKFKDNSANKIETRERTLDFLSRLEKLDDDEKETLKQESAKILSHCLSSRGNTGLAFGYVQSGKTMSFTALTTLAVDNGYDIVIFLAGTANNLLDQTGDRLYEDLNLKSRENSNFYKIFKNPEQKDSARILSWLNPRRRRVVLIPILKSTKRINSLLNVFASYEFSDIMKDRRVLIIDDEVDQASLNTFARKNSNSEDWEEDQTSSTYSSILKLKSSFPSHSYVQYTATPQGPVLISMMDLLSPKFHVVLTPGKSYTGGKAFFIDNIDKNNKPELIITIPNEEVYHHKDNDLSECPDSLIDALHVFLISVAININIQEKEDLLSMMVHADREIDVSNKFYNWISNILLMMNQKLDLPDTEITKTELISRLKTNYNEAIKKLKKPPPFDEVLNEIQEVIELTDLYKVIGKETPIDWKKTSYSNILVGADLLNRGFTVEGLTVTYMPRHPKGKNNADTMQQRCRFFGYKKNYLENCRVYLPNQSIEEFVEYVHHEETLRQNLKESSLEQVRTSIALTHKLNPTRNNILSESIIRTKMIGWKQLKKISSISYVEENIKYVENDFLPKQKFSLFEDYSTKGRNHNFAELNIDEVIKFISNFKVDTVPDVIRKSSTIQYLNHLSATGKIKSAYLFDMAFGETNGKERGLLKGSKNEINNLFTGPNDTGGSIYPGDREVKVEEFFCIQIHRIKITNKYKLGHGKKVYGLAFYYPKNLSYTYISTTPTIIT